MKVAIVSQPTDDILPPYQNSIGYYSWSLAQQLARRCDVTVYGRKEINEEIVRLDRSQPELRTVASTTRERAFFRGRVKLGRLVQIWSPLSTSPRYFPDYARSVAAELSREQFDVIHVQHCTQFLPVIRAANPAAKIVFHLHAEWFSQSNFDELRRRLKHADFVFAVSDHIVAQTVKVFPEVRDRIRTIHCGINVHEFDREKDYTASRGRNERRILYCGAISPHKGPHVLLDAFRIVAAQEPRVRLEFVGLMSNYPLEENFDLSDKESLRQLAPFYANNWTVRLRSKIGMAAPNAGTYQAYLMEKITPEIADKVTFRGFIPRHEQIERFYTSDIFAFAPVWNEGCGIPPIEGMAAGLPVVGSRSGGLMDTVKDGETGFLVDKNDAPALADRILKLVRDDELRETMGRAARRRALEQFEWKWIAEKAETQYRILTGLGKSNHENAGYAAVARESVARGE